MYLEEYEVTLGRLVNDNCMIVVRLTTVTEYKQTKTKSFQDLPNMEIVQEYSDMETLTTWHEILALKRKPEFHFKLAFKA